MGAQPANETILEFKGVNKDFPGIRALDKGGRELPPLRVMGLGGHS
jgi:ABC-type sugar transport system ATPase subunit